MAINLTGSITGSAVSGLTSPTYTLSTDTAPDVNAKQAAITGLGGTQTGVTVHTVASPFTIAFWRPKVLALLGKPSVTTGVIDKVPMNVYKFITRKGVTPAANQPARAMIIRTEISVPAGSDTNDPNNIAAAISAHCGGLNSYASGISDSVKNGII